MYKMKPFIWFVKHKNSISTWHRDIRIYQDDKGRGEMRPHLLRDNLGPWGSPGSRQGSRRQSGTQDKDPPSL